jgi:predicted nucleic acid-binding protein
VIVLDASAAVDLLLERGEQGRWVQGRLVGRELVAAPHVIDLEVASALRRLGQLGEIGSRRGRSTLLELLEMPMQRYPVTALLGRIWALREGLTPYDAAYVALAEALDLPLVTTDARLGRSSGHSAKIEAFPG